MNACESNDDRAIVTQLLGRDPSGLFEVVVRDAEGVPVVLRNDPFFGDGTPMPTRYWLVGKAERLMVSRLEAAGGVARSEADVDAAELRSCHDAYGRERDAQIAADHEGPRPSGGVGGTRKGVKCLHAHYAHHLAGGDDPVGRWVSSHLHEVTR